MYRDSVTKKDDIPNNWHFVCYVPRVAKGFSLVIMEMTSVTPEVRITNGYLGLWSSKQTPSDPFKYPKLYKAVIEMPQVAMGAINPPPTLCATFQI